MALNGVFPIRLSYRSGAPESQSLQALPTEGKRGPFYVNRIVGRLNLVWAAAAVSNAVTGRRMLEVISSMTLGSQKSAVGVENLSGAGIRWLQRALTGRAPIDPADQAANGNATITRQIKFVLNFADPRAENPGDGAIPAGYLQRGRVQVQWAPNGLFGTGNVIDAATFLDLLFEYEELEDETRAASRVLYRQAGFERYLNGSLQPGVITDLLLVPLDGATELASDDFTTFIFREDGNTKIHEIDVDQLVDMFNADMVLDGAGLATAPEDSATVQVEELPLIWPGWSYKISKLPFAENAFGYTMGQGAGAPAVNTIQFVERRILPNTDADIVAQVASCGCDEAKVRKALEVAARLPAEDAVKLVKWKTASKVPLRGGKAGRLAPFLPVRVDLKALDEVAKAVS